MSVLRRPATLAALGVLLLLTVACLAAPWLAPHQPNQADLGAVLAGPSSAHLLGTDELGRDILSRLLYGGRPTLGYSALVVATATLIAVPVGLISGLVGGRTDRWLMRATDLGLSMPVMILVLVVVSIFGDRFALAMVGLGILLAPPMVRNIRGPALAVRAEPYIDAARTAGLSQLQIVRRHVLPRVRGPILVQLTLMSAIALLLTSSLAFLGFGVTVPDASWGGMVQEASLVLNRSSWLLIDAGGVTGVYILCLGLVGDGIRDAAVASWSAPARPASARRTQPPAGADHSSAEQPAVVRTPGALLELRDLSVAYPRDGALVPAAERVDLVVRPGEIVGLVGESGCGKTSVARAVLRLLRGGGQITGGQIRFDGIEVLGLSTAELRRFRGGSVAYVSQEPMVALDPTFRVGHQLAEAVRTNTELRGAKVHTRVAELLEMVRLPDPDRVARLYPHELSGGMAQRVAIARALAAGPRLLIADEPTTALDATVQAEILGLLRRLHEETGLAVLLVSHDWHVVSALCDRAVVMYAGQIVEEAPLGGLLANPAHPYTGGLLACQPARAPLAARRLPTIEGSVPDARDWPTTCRFAARCDYRVDECEQTAVPLLRSDVDHNSRCLRIVAVTAGGPR